MPTGPIDQRERAPSGVADAMSRLGLGTAAWMAGYGLAAQAARSRADIDALLAAAVADGIRYLDTAAGYGEVERLLGCLAERWQPAEVRVCTKVQAQQIRQGMALSLARLGVHRLDTMLLHSASAAQLCDEDVVQAMRHSREAGRVCRLGASTYGVEDACAAIEQAWCEVVQIEHSVLNPSVLHAVARRRRPGQELVVRSVLCQGLLSPRRRQARDVPAHAQRRLDALAALAGEWGLTLPQLAVRFALDSPDVDRVLVGIADVEEWREVAEAAARPPLASWQMERLAVYDASAEDWTHPERWTRS